jgi:hypothetical protein
MDKIKPRWCVENFTGDNGYEDLIAEIRNQGYDCNVLDIRNHFTLQKDIFKPNDCVVFQGSIQLFRKLKKELGAIGCKPIGWMTDENYLCSNYYPRFKKYLFNDNHILIPLGELLNNRWDYYANFGKEAMIFIRPDGGDKAFKGMLLDLQDFDRFFSSGVNSKLNPDDFVVISTPKNIRGEWRYICSASQDIVASSLYIYQGQRTYVPSAPEKATMLVKEILKVGWYPDPIFTIDIAEDMDGNYWLMEFNSFTSAGTYAADKTKIVKVVSELAEKCYVH